MKKFRLVPFLCTALVLLFAGACSDDENSADGTPTVVFSPEPVLTASSVTFTVTTTEADRAAWVVAARQTDAPDAQEILNTGTPLQNGTQTLTKDGLTSGVAYVLYAAAARGEALSEVATLTFTTPAEGGGEK